ncbi:FAD-dependent oxidoreductase [Sciscionella marina]|uniref:FAD-dependent oxidoreductase n=1 Tax=Sciscionella marina TaxID=508770 RepID=UPI00035C858C|nr:FAD-dependent oxidoreductase [Sciscionella marina]
MHDVAIVGAGPVGLFLACELGLAGCSVLVLEREPEPGSPWRTEPLGTRGLSATSLEAFHRRGMLDQLLAASGAEPVTSPETDAPQPPHIVGHFAGTVLDPAKVELGAWPYRLPTPAPEFLMTTLDAVESVLAERADKLGVEIRRGVTVDEIAQDEQGVTVHAGVQRYPARWLVGCDGGRSTVRKLAGFAFTGTEPLFTGYVMLAELEDPEKLTPGINLTATGTYLRLEAEGHLGMMDFDGGAFDRTQRLTREHLQEVLRRVSGTDVTLTGVTHASSFTDRAMRASTYRHGRILLAGDAAHIHSPLGGQGLNLGLADAVNLGWKLAATTRGQAPDGVLDSYAREREPIADSVLDWSRAQVAIMRPGSHTDAVQGLVRDLLATEDGTTYVFRRFTGAAIRHDLGGEHPLVGGNAPDFRFADGIHLGELMADGRGLALEFGTEDRLRGAVEGREDRLRHVGAPVRNDLGLGAVLIRPDGIVVWASDRGADPAGFERAVERWFGGPR